MFLLGFRRTAAGVSALLASAAIVCVSFANAPSPASDTPTAADSYAYRLEQPGRNYKDVVTFTNQAKAIGKVMEWADQVLVYDAAGGLRAWPVREIESIDLRRIERHNERPALPDLTVAFVERLPRDPSFHGRVSTSGGIAVASAAPDASKWSPKAGDEVTYRLHILNAGAADSSPVTCRVSIGGKAVSTFEAPALKPGASHASEVKWNWQDGSHELRVEIDPEGKVADLLRWNNTFTQPTQARAVVFVVARDRYEAFTRTPNVVDSFCFEDYAQYHVRCLNALFSASVYPASPLGVVDRIACDRIVVVDDPFDAAAEASWMSALKRDGRPDGVAEYAALARFGRLESDESAARDALMVDWSALKGIGRDLGLVDLKLKETSIDQCYVFDISERYAMLQYLSPWRASLMHTPGGFALTEEQAAYLNQTIGRLKGMGGEYLHQLPKTIAIKVLATDGRPLGDVQIDVFQKMSEGPDAGRIIGIGSNDPIVSMLTDAEGRAELVNLDAPKTTTPGGYTTGPNPFGPLAPDGSNGLLLLRLRAGAMDEDFHFLPIEVCNAAYLRGHRDVYEHVIQTRFASPDATLPQPPFAAVEMWERDRSPPPLVLTWIVPKEVERESIEEFRVYKRTGFAGQETKPWTLVSVHHPPVGRNFPHGIESYFDEFKYDGPHTLDTYFAVSTVDKEGHESGLSAPGFVPYKKDGVRFAVDKQYAFMTARGEGAAHMFFWDGRAGTQPHQMKTDALPGYRPGFEGIAFMPDGRLIVTDPENHVLALYDPVRSELIETLPQRNAWPGRSSIKEGEFSDPADIAIDDASRMYVADRGNHPAPTLHGRGTFVALLDPDFPFRRPSPVPPSHGHLRATDKNGTRCRVYDIREGEPRFVLELPPLVDADRAAVNAKGKIFITGRQDHVSPWTMLSYVPDGYGGAVYSGSGVQGEMGSYEKPRSLYQHRGNPMYVYMMNEFPYDVRRLHIQQD